MATDVDWEDFDGFDNFGIGICTSSTRPTGGALHEGRFIYETNTDKTYYYSGSAWVKVSTGGTIKIFIPWFQFTNFTETYDGNFAGLYIDTSTDGKIRGNTIIPPDFLSGAKIYCIFKAVSTANADVAFSIDYGAVGESPTTHSASGGGTVACTAGNIMKSAEVSLASAVIGDVIGIEETTLAGYNYTALYFYGFILEYES